LDGPAQESLAPFSLRDAPSLIERVFPAQKVGIEAQSERSAGPGQTLTPVGSYWKGRKPLILTRACVLASLIPPSENPEEDLKLIEALLGMDDAAMRRRRPDVKPRHIVKKLPRAEWVEHIEQPKPDEGDAEPPEPKWIRINLQYLRDPNARKRERERITAEREALKSHAFGRMSFAEKVDVCERVEKVESISDEHDPFYAGVWDRVNARLGTNARTILQFVHQLGVARFGHQLVVGDPFCGGGSTPFEAARIGCAVVASDLNPVATMLTWAALNVIGANRADRGRIAEEQEGVARAVDAEITRLGIEHDEFGNRGKAYLYCLEVVDPQTGWLVPLISSWVISTKRRIIARPEPDYGRKRFDILIEEGVSAEALKAARTGTDQGGELVYNLAPIPGVEVQEWRIPIQTLRGDGKGPVQPDGSRGNTLRRWTKDDIAPMPARWDAQADPVAKGASRGAWIGGDLFQERLYCIQWLDAEDIAEGKARPKTWFAAPTAADLNRESRIREIVQENLPKSQAAGFIPDMPIAPGYNTNQPIRERGWTYWHHLFNPRNLLPLSILAQHRDPISQLQLSAALDYNCRGVRWDYISLTTLSFFTNQALNTMTTYACRGSTVLLEALRDKIPCFPIQRAAEIATVDARDIKESADIWVYDPPYANAVIYHEITEFFIAWLRKNPPREFVEWIWDSRRPLAIQGKGDKFRADMAASLQAMSAHMPDNGLQICMFTSQDVEVWADLAEIVWASGLQVTAAWYVSTETDTAMRRGTYVQGTVLLVMRKRGMEDSTYSDELIPQIKLRVEEQVRTLLALNEAATAGRGEHPFRDADIQMAGYAAALEVLTAYTKVDGQDMTRAALRPRADGGSGTVTKMIEFAVQTATELMVPEGLDAGLWQRLNNASERFWLKMAEVEGRRAAGAFGKLDEYQTFAQAFRCTDWRPMMHEATANKARLRGAVAFGRTVMEGHEFARGLVRPVLYAIRGLVIASHEDSDPGEAGTAAIHTLRDLFGPEWLRRRGDAMAIAGWLGRSQVRSRPEEAEAARVLAELIRTERLQ
jgi:putative DNA methylase